VIAALAAAAVACLVALALWLTRAGRYPMR
jgi:hypothetical protein